MITHREIRFMRVCLRMSKAELARRLCISRQHMSNIENQHKGLSEDMQHQIINIFKKALFSQFSDTNQANKVMNSIKDRIKKNTCVSN